MTPPRPEAPRFDPAQNAWVLSRYPDVWAALREPHLWPVSGKREIQPETREDDGRLKQWAAMLEALSAARLEEWRPRLEALTFSALDRLPTDREVDLFGDFTLPWGLTLAMLVTGADPADSRRLADLGGRVFAATGESEDAALRADAASATAELERIFETGPIPMEEPAFVALSQTLPRLLANAWLALVRHPTEFAHLRAHPELMPGAIEELLRYAGIVRRVFRRATATVDLGGVSIAEGELARLMLASANRDPEQFPDPDRLLLARPVMSHVALGTGRNSCVGAMLIRMAASVATGALAAKFAEVSFGLHQDPPRGRPRFPGFRVLSGAALPRYHRTPARPVDDSRQELSVSRAPRPAAHREAVRPAATHRRPGRGKLLAVLPPGATRPSAHRDRHPGRSAGRPRRRPPLSGTHGLSAGQRGVRQSAPGRGQPGRGHLQRVHTLLHRLPPHAHRNPPLPAARRLLSDRRFANLPAPRARGTDAPRAPPAIPGDLRVRLRHARKH